MVMIFWFTIDPIKNALGSSVYHYYKKQINLNVKLPTKKQKKHSRMNEMV